ncbi:MAG TPA: F0F1 ATP synthase subunit delta, partial [Rhodospirillales bacterium]|nr:F0F1 ATP synthase subunit delta [Rhodospirillales bacterium]
ASEILKVFKAVLGEKVNLTTRLDASILGGLVVKIGSRMIDSSLKNKLQKLRLALRGVG